MTEEKIEVIKYRISKAYEVFEESQLLFSQDYFFGTTNRLYYSCFYAVLALLLLKDLNSKTHKGVLMLFYKNFIATNIFEKKWNSLYHKMYDARHEGDYIDKIEMEKEEVESYIPEVKDFIDTINSYIAKEIS